MLRACDGKGDGRTAGSTISIRRGLVANCKCFRDAFFASLRVLTLHTISPAAHFPDRYRERTPHVTIATLARYLLWMGYCKRSKSPANGFDHVYQTPRHIGLYTIGIVARGTRHSRPRSSLDAGLLFSTVVALQPSSAPTQGHTSSFPMWQRSLKVRGAFFRVCKASYLWCGRVRLVRVSVEMSSRLVGYWEDVHANWLAA